MEALQTSIDEILGLERRALERWCRGDPSGFLEISASDVAYFDPFLERRVDGLVALTAYYESLRGKIFAQRFEILVPRVQLLGDAGVLTFHFVSHGEPGEVHRWNCTEVYRRGPEGWRIVQSHWSVTGRRTS